MTTPTPPTVRATRHTHARATDLAIPEWERRVVGVWNDCTNIIRDKPGSGFSMTKIIAGFFAYLVGVSIRLQAGHVDANTLWLAFASLAAAFGKSTFNFLLSKASMNSSLSASDARFLERKESVIVVDATTRHIDETIGRGPAGEPLRSNPPTPGALSPAEEQV